MGTARWNFYFRLFPGEHPQPAGGQISLPRHMPGKPPGVWDGLRRHRSRLVWDFLRQQRGNLARVLARYAPELNPVALEAAPATEPLP